MLSRIANYVDRHFVGVLVSVLLGWYALTALGRPFGDTIRSDGLGYYAYLPSLILYGDPSFRSLAEAQYEGLIPGYSGLEVNPENGIYVNKFNLGVALFALPFFLLAHGATWLMNAPAGDIPTWWAFQYPLDGYSPFYQHAAGLSGLFYFALGCVVLRRFLRTFFSSQASSVAILLLLFGTCWLDIGAGWSFSSHGISTLLFALFFLVANRWVDEPDRWRDTILLGALLGLIALVRVPNLLVVLALALLPSTQTTSLPAHIKRLFRLIPQFVVMAAVALVAFLPQMVFWKYGAGHWLVNSYGDRGLPHLTSPALMEVLFSLNKGIFVWSPILLLAIPGWFTMKQESARWRLTVAVLLVLQWYVIASAAVWNAGACFGQRYFAEFQTLAAIPFAALVSRSRGRGFLWMVILATVLWSVFLYKLYYTREISVYGLDGEAFYDILWWRLQSLKNWWIP